MSPLAIGSFYGTSTLVVMFSGIPIAFALGIVALVFMYFFMPASALDTVAQNVLPPLKAAGFDLIWFGIVMTIVMETGLIHPPVGLNIFVIKNIAPDIPLSDITWGVMPFVVIMIATVILLCFVPGIAMWLPAVLSS
jgi:C4-dicarboxylate transporter, DctM subunit